MTPEKVAEMIAEGLYPEHAARAEGCAVFLSGPVAICNVFVLPSGQFAVSRRGEQGYFVVAESDIPNLVVGLSWWLKDLRKRSGFPDLKEFLKQFGELFK